MKEIVSESVYNKCPPAEYAAARMEATGLSDPALARHQINRALESYYLPIDKMDKEELGQRFDVAFEFLRSIKPRDALEGTLAMQMLATHNAAMELLQRAMVTKQSLKTQDMNLRHVEKLFALFTRQLEALNRHRGKGQQKITVEHVEVQSGGRAIVGNVER